MFRSWPYLSLLLLICACAQRKGPLPAEYKNLIYKPGDCIAFRIDSNRYARAAIYDVKKDSNGLWYAMCFLDLIDSIPPTTEQLEKSSLSGRKIESAVSSKEYVVGIDVEWLHETCIVLNREKTKRIGHYTFKPMQPGSERNSEEYDLFVAIYEMSTAKRATPPDDYLAYHQKSGNDFRPEEYFPLKDFIIDDKK